MLGLFVVLACVGSTGACGESPLHSDFYDRCRTSSQCGGGRTCVQVRSAPADAGETLVGICSRPCTVSTYAQAVYGVARALGNVCVSIDETGKVDTSSLGGSGWYLVACGSDHVRAGYVDDYAVCTPFDYGGYPIDLWIPTP